MQSPSAVSAGRETKEWEACLLDCVRIWEGLHSLLPVTAFLTLCGIIAVAELRCKVNVSVPFGRHRKHWATRLGPHQPGPVSAAWGHCLRNFGCERGLAGVCGCAALLLFWQVGEQDELAGPGQDEEEALGDLALLHQERPLLVCALFHIRHCGLDLRKEQGTRTAIDSCGSFTVLEARRAIDLHSAALRLPHAPVDAIATGMCCLHAVWNPELALCRTDLLLQGSQHLRLLCGVCICISHPLTA